MLREAKNNWEHFKKANDEPMADAAWGRIDALNEVIKWADVLDDKANGTIS